MELLSRTDVFMLYVEVRIDFFSAFELLFTKLKIRIRLVRAGPKLYTTSENLKTSFGVVCRSLYNHRIALKDDYDKRGMKLLAYALL